MSQELISKIQKREACVGVVGLGYVGLPLALTFSEAGFRVVGFDIDPRKIERLAAGESYIEHIPSERVRASVGRGRFSATSAFDKTAECDALIMCVPTPLTKQREPDLQFITKTAQSLAPFVRRAQLYVLESTTYPGTTDEVVKPILEQGGLKAGKDFHLAFSPEREDPGNARFTTSDVPKVVGGHTPACLEIACALYGAVIKRTVPVSSMQAAEMTKLLENIYRSVNIALVNELKVLCLRMGLDIWEIVDAAATKPYGFQPFYPGPGLGGHCIPIDPFYLTWKAREFELQTRFIELAGEVNSGMPQFVVQRVMEALNEKSQCLKGAKLLVLGVAYKKDVDDMRESPSVRVIELLEDHGAVVAYHDPHVSAIPPMRQHHLQLRSQPLTPELLQSHQAALILTDHSRVDYEMVVRHSPLVVDTRNAVRRAGIKGANVFAA